MKKNKSTNPDREAFKSLLQSVERLSQEDVDYLMEDLDGWEFFKMPASCRKHSCYEGGLVKHSLHVCEMAKMLRKQILLVRPDLESLLPLDSVIIASLLHDVCKAGIYKKVSRRQKNEIGLWETNSSYGIDYSYLPVGHGEKSVYMLSGFMRLTREEAMAINWHMGAFDERAKSNSMILKNVFLKHKIAFLFHLADYMTTYLDEETIEN